MLEGIGEKFKSLNDRGPQAPSPAYEEVTSAAGGGYGPQFLILYEHILSKESPPHREGWGFIFRKLQHAQRLRAFRRSQNTGF
jgi:hypothetical protein